MSRDGGGADGNLNHGKMQGVAILFSFVLAASVSSSLSVKCPVLSFPGGTRDIRVYTTSIATAEESDSIEDEFSDEIEPSRALDVESLCLEHNSNMVATKES